MKSFIKTSKQGTPYAIHSQDPQFLDHDSVKKYLPSLLTVLNTIEEICGYRWQITSYARNSPSHQRCISLDIAPDISPSAAHLYSANQKSDPVLYKREVLIRKLQTVASHFNTGGGPALDFPVGIFIEPDHLHLQVFDSLPDNRQIVVVKWKQPKSCYPDTMERIKLPLITNNS